MMKIMTMIMIVMMKYKIQETRTNIRRLKEAKLRTVRQRKCK